MYEKERKRVGEKDGKSGKSGKKITVEEMRERLQEWFDKTENGAVFIKKGDKKYVMLKDEEYFDMIESITTLQKALNGVLNNEEVYTADDLLKRKKKK